MSVRRSSRRSSRGDVTAPGREIIVGNDDNAVEDRDTNQSPANMEGDRISTNNNDSNSSARPKRLFVGDSVVFCPSFAHPKTASTIINSAIGDVKEAAANLTFDSIQATGTASSDSIVHTPTPSSSNDDKRPKRKAPSKSLSSFTSLDSELNGKETQKKKKRPAFNRKLRITLTTSKPKSPSTKGSSNNKNNKECTNNDNRHCYIQNSRKNNNDPQQLTIQHLLSLRTERSLQAQSNLSLLQLKQLARQKARANKPDKTQKKPKRKKRSKKKGSNNKQKPKSPGSNENDMLEPVTKTEMNTGTLLLFRGENPRAKFVWRK
mmetsp:Transcript_41118/g.86228  ORF Transcript_41118/g.86228 Transcript_41118/m.86228 type:complete len:320 (+) Transcript_41118:233-1192(+)